MINLNLFQWVDKIFDDVAYRLAQNLSSNIETVARNRAARVDSEAAKQRSSQRRDISQGKNVYPIRARSQLSQKELAQRVQHLINEQDYKQKDKNLFTA